MRPDCLKFNWCHIPIRLCDDDCSDLDLPEEGRHPLEDDGQADYLRDMDIETK
jgi:hypothetical protein